MDMVSVTLWQYCLLVVYAVLAGAAVERSYRSYKDTHARVHVLHAVVSLGYIAGVAAAFAGHPQGVVLWVVCWGLRRLLCWLQSAQA